MKRGLPSRIALRYLLSKKSYSAVTAISIVSVTGVAVATAAIVCVLSVFNGFRETLTAKLDILSPDVTVTPAKGKIITGADSLLSVLKDVKGVERIMPTVEDNALAVYDAREMPVKVRGVDETLYRRMTRIDSVIVEGGKFKAASRTLLGPEDEYGERMEELRGDVSVSAGVAVRLSIYDMNTGMLLFAPRRGVRVNPANPLASFVCDSVTVCGVYQTQQAQFDYDMVLTDLAVARSLFELGDDEITGVDVQVAPGESDAAVADRIDETLGAEYVVKNRLRQQAENYRMIEIEKWVTFLLLFFILMIAGFNLISTLSMLVLEKRKSLKTLHSMGMRRRDIGRVFAFESFYVTLSGGLPGMIIGVVLCLLQQRYGFIKLNADPSTMVTDAYPVAVQWTDLLIVMIPLVVTGALTALVASGYAKRKLKE
ncbi:MAG: ABC transporter permease [Muribaculaceae bacterium]|nr:ABC transporter permease [Muribaculaceae bacterium]